MTAPLAAPPTVAELLDFEAGHRRHTGDKEMAIIRQLGITPARYYQLLHRAVPTEEALRHDPILTNRLRDAYGRRRGLTL